MLTFGDASLPHLLSLLANVDAAKARVAASVLCRFRGGAIVGPLLAYAEANDLTKDPDVGPHVTEALDNATFLRFKSLKEMAEWHRGATHKTQVEWLWEAINHPDRERARRDSAVKGIQHLLYGPPRLKALLRCFLDLEWIEAGFALYWETGHPSNYGGRNLRDPLILAKEKASWAEFRDLPESDQMLDVALHCVSRHAASYPGTLMSPAEAGRWIVRQADKAFDRLEQIASKHPDCHWGFYAALPFVATSASWERLEKLFATLKQPNHSIGQVLENATHPSIGDKMLDMVIAGAAEGVTYRCLMTAFPKRVRPDMVPRILEALREAQGRTRETLLGALAASGDLRGWEILEKEVFSDANKGWQSTEYLENFAGEKAVAEIRKLLKNPVYQVITIAARMLADRGDLSGVPVLIDGLDTCDIKTESRFYLWSLGWIRGGYPKGLKMPLTRSSRADAVADFKAWWNANKERSRHDWLLECLDVSAGDFTPGVPAFYNPLLFLAEDEFKDVPETMLEPDRGKVIAARVRAWVAKTGFTFNKDTVRVPYRPKSQGWPR